MATVNLHMGTTQRVATALVTNNGDVRPTANGEFGVGSYYWLEDIPAAFLSATQYHGNKDGGWAIVQFSFDDADLRNAASHRFLGRNGGEDGGSFANRVRDDSMGYGPRIVDFTRQGPKRIDTLHDVVGENVELDDVVVLNRGSRLTTNFIVPPSWSELPSDIPHGGGSNDSLWEAQTRGDALKDRIRVFGKMNASDFRRLNQNYAELGLGNDPSNKVSWQYDMVLGRSAAAEDDQTLIQVKFANRGLTFLNNSAIVTRTILVRGKKISAKWKNIESWKMNSRQKLYKLYLEDFITTQTECDLDSVI
jgi:hypothetical protein